MNRNRRARFDVVTGIVRHIDIDEVVENIEGVTSCDAFIELTPLQRRECHSFCATVVCMMTTDVFGWLSERAYRKTHCESVNAKSQK